MIIITVINHFLIANYIFVNRTTFTIIANIIAVIIIITVTSTKNFLLNIRYVYYRCISPVFSIFFENKISVLSNKWKRRNRRNAIRDDYTRFITRYSCVKFAAYTRLWLRVFARSCMIFATVYVRWNIVMAYCDCSLVMSRWPMCCLCFFGIQSISYLSRW